MQHLTAEQEANVRRCANFQKAAQDSQGQHGYPAVCPDGLCEVFAEKPLFASDDEIKINLGAVRGTEDISCLVKP